MNLHFSAKGKRGEIWIYDQIGAGFFSDGITDDQFRKELTALGPVNELSVHINSPGGDVFQGFAIYNLLAQHPARVTVDIDGVAASIASIIAMAGDEIRIAKNASLMIHNPRGMAMGDEQEMNRVAALLKSVKGNLVDTYHDRTGHAADQLSAWMDEETWFTAQQAVENGFATSITPETRVNACFDLLREYRNMPDRLKAELKAREPQPQPVLDIRRSQIDAAGRRLAALLT